MPLAPACYGGRIYCAKRLGERKMRKLFLLLIRFYQVALSPLLGQNCRFYPTCSHYMYEAIEKHGVATGGWMGIKRLLRCHPWYKGDLIDPVP